MGSPQDLAENALARGAGVDGCMAIVDETATVNVRWANSTLTTNGAARSRRLTLMTMVGGHAGAVSKIGDFDQVALVDLVAAAKAAAKGAEVMAAAVMGAAGGGTDAAAPALPLVDGGVAADWAQPAPGTEVATLAGFSRSLRDEAERAAGHGAHLTGYAEQQVRTTYLASSTGLRLRHVQPTAVVDLAAGAGDGSTSAWAGAGPAHIHDVDLAMLGAQLDERLAWPRRRARLRPGKYEVLLAPPCVADLMVHVYQAAGAHDAVRGQGVFGEPRGAARLGERLSTAALTLRSDPREPGLECAPFTIARATGERVSLFDSGMPLHPTRWVTNGVLTALVQTRLTARRMAQPTTGEIDNLVLEGPPGAPSLSEMIAGTERALLVNTFWYVREVDPRRLVLTGLTRHGVYLVERGEVTTSLPDFRFNESPVDMMSRISEVGGTSPTLRREWGDYFTRVAMPALRVEDFDVSAVSKV